MIAWENETAPTLARVRAAGACFCGARLARRPYAFDSGLCPRCERDTPPALLSKLRAARGRWWRRWWRLAVAVIRRQDGRR